MPTKTKAPTGANLTVPNPDSMYEDPPLGDPYYVDWEIEGTREYLFNRYDVPVAGTDQNLKGQTAVKTPGELVTVGSDGNLAASKLQVWNAVCAAGKYRKNPRSSKGSLGTVLREAFEIESTGPDTDLLPFISPEGDPYVKWEWEFTARTKKSGAFAGYVTKVRPGLQPGWRLAGRAVGLGPQYITVRQLHEAFEMAGRFGGIGDGRSGGLGFGRFLVVVSKVEWIGPHRIGTERTGLQRQGWDWQGRVRIGMERNGLDGKG